MLILNVLFMLTACCVLMTYFGYPAVLKLLLFFHEKKVHKKNISPSVSLVVNIHNEEQIIEQKILNVLALDYPEDKLEILISSDGSSDRSIEIAASYAEKHKQVKVFDYKEHRGKIYAINETVSRAGGSIIAFSDANAMLEPAALGQLIKNFADENVGCVCGELKYSRNNSSEAGEGLYKRYENLLKAMESRLGSITGAEGSFFAVRKDLFQNIPHDFSEDIILVYRTVMQGKRAVYEKKAVSVEEFPLKLSNEILRRARIVTHNLTMLWKTSAILNPFQYGFYSCELILHKLLRWFSPFFLILIFLLNVILSGQNLFTSAALFLQIAFYICGAMHPAVSRIFHKKILLFYAPFFFIISNIGMLLGFYFFCTQKLPVKWEVKR